MAASPVAAAVAPERAARARVSPARAQLLGALAAEVLLLGLFYSLGAPLWSGSLPLAPRGEVSATPGVGTAGWLLCAYFCFLLIAPFGAYAQALRQLARRDNTAGPRLVVGGAAVLALAMLLLFPGFGSDVGEYLVHGRLLAVHGLNPLVTAPQAVPGDPLYPYSWFPTAPTVYGPLWTGLMALMALLPGGPLLGPLVGLKALALAAYAACLWLIWRLGAGWARRRRLAALALFAWNPLVLFDGLGKTHNDLPIAALLLAALAARRRPVLAGLLLAAAALVKYNALLVGPALLLGVYLERRRVADALRFGAAALAGGVLGLAPLWAGPASLAAPFTQLGRPVWSPSSMLGALVASDSPAPLGVRVVAAGAFVLVLLLASRHQWRHRDTAGAMAVAFLGGTLLLGSAVFAHYLMVAVGLAAVSRSGRVRWAAGLLALGGMAAYAVDLLGLPLGSAFAGSPAYRVLGTLVLLAPLAGGGLVWAARRQPATLPGWPTLAIRRT